MSRDFSINGETLVRVAGGPSILYGIANKLPTSSGTQQLELGLSITDGIKILPNFHHYDQHADDYGPNVPADVQSLLADCTIRMGLIDVDTNILDMCLSCSLGGAFNTGGIGALAGIMPGAGQLLGNFLPLYTSGNYFTSIHLTSPILLNPWRFPACYLSRVPFEVELGTNRSIWMLDFRCIPYSVPLLSGGSTSGQVNYSGEIQSSGAILWDRNTPNT